MTRERSDLWDPNFAGCAPATKSPAPRPHRGFRPTTLETVAVCPICGILAGLILPSAFGPSYDRTIVLPPPSGRAPDPEIAKIAGDYHQIGWSLTVTPDGRYSFVHSACVGIAEKDHGYARFVDGRLRPFPTLPRLQPRQGGDTWLTRLPTGLVPVRWGDRRYLIPEEAAAEFCGAIGRGREPRTGYRGLFFLNTLDPEKPVDGLPDVPDRWKSMLPERPPAEEPLRPTADLDGHGG